jgi:hypothetical protein
MINSFTQKLLITLLVLLLGFNYNLLSQEHQENQKVKQNKLNPGLNLDDAMVSNLDGAYSVITVNNGETTELNIKFNNGRITTIIINGEEIPRDKWLEYEDLLLDYISYIDPDKPQKYRYKEWYDIEYELRQDLHRMHRQIRQLEINQRIKKFYDEEMREWVEELEEEINESEFINDLDEIFDDFIRDLDQFLAERKAYFNEKYENNNPPDSIK